MQDNRIFSSGMVTIVSTTVLRSWQSDFCELVVGYDWDSDISRN